MIPRKAFVSSTSLTLTGATLLLLLLLLIGLLLLLLTTSLLRGEVTVGTAIAALSRHLQYSNGHHTSHMYCGYHNIRDPIPSPAL
jgi:hypothetical protein